MAAVLCNASPLLARGKLNRLHLLSGLPDQVQLPRAVTGTIRLVAGALSAVKTRESWYDHAHEGKPGLAAS